MNNVIQFKLLSCWWREHFSDLVFNKTVEKDWNASHWQNKSSFGQWKLVIVWINNKRIYIKLLHLFFIWKLSWNPLAWAMSIAIVVIQWEEKCLSWNNCHYRWLRSDVIRYDMHKVYAYTDDWVHLKHIIGFTWHSDIRWKISEQFISMNTKWLKFIHKMRHLHVRFPIHFKPLSSFVYYKWQ